MIKHLSISETRKRISSLEQELSHEETISVTNHGKEVLAVMRWDTYEAIAETLEILADDESYSELKQGLEQLRKGELVDLEDLKKELNVHG